MDNRDFKEINFKRLEADFDEKLNWQILKNKAFHNLFHQKLAEMTSELGTKVDYLSQIEKAIINILEDNEELRDNFEKARDRAQAIVSSIGEGLIVINRDYKIVLINKAAERLLEISEKQASGKNAKDIIKMYRGENVLSDDERPVERMFKDGQPVIIEIEDNLYYQISSGRKFPITLTAAPLWGGGVIGAVVVFRDVTNEKALEESRKSFISITSHQLRTPLTSIRWYAEMLINGDAGRLNKNQKEFSREIYSAVLKLNETVNLLLAISRLESGKTEFKPSDIDLAFFIKDVIRGLDPLIKQKNIKTELSINDNISKKISIDKAILGQVVTNLLSNAINYTDNKGRIEIGIKKEENNVVCYVKDDGIGIPDNQKGSIFNKFFRADNALAKVPSGTGLGLNLAKGLVEKWNGKMWFESPVIWKNKSGKEEKKGTIFLFTIPII